jgi:hypothetical protein
MIADSSNQFSDSLKNGWYSSSANSLPSAIVAGVWLRMCQGSRAAGIVSVAPMYEVMFAE